MCDVKFYQTDKLEVVYIYEYKIKSDRQQFFHHFHEP